MVGADQKRRQRVFHISGSLCTTWQAGLGNTNNRKEQGGVYQLFNLYDCMIC